MSYKDRFNAREAHRMMSAPTITVRGRLLDLTSPQVMGILNATPDSFYEESRTLSEETIAQRADEIVGQGGAMVDIGAFSTRPGGEEVTQQEEMRRLRLALSVVTRRHPEVIVSVDTFRPDVARMAVEEYGVAMINDVSEGGITGVAGVARREKREDVPAFPRRERHHPRPWFWFRQDAGRELPAVVGAGRPASDGTAGACGRVA